MSAAPQIALSRLGRAALRYAEHGWAVFPLGTRSKVPLVAGGDGFLSATSDVDQVRAWWLEHPDANIGLWPGQSGLVVLDEDGPDGFAAGAALGAHAEPTLVCVSGRTDGGRHLYFRRPPFHVANAKLTNDKLEVRGDAGYVVVPPSVHPSGRTYAWVGRVDEIRELPPKVLMVLQDAAHRSAVTPEGAILRPARDLLFEPVIGEGGRNNSLTRYTGRLLAKGIPDDETLRLVSAVNATQCRPPLPQPEVNAIVAKIARREAAKRLTGGGTTLSLVADERAGREDAENAPAVPTPSSIAAAQIDRAKTLLTRDVSSAPRWAWSDLTQMVGPMLPGELIVVGSLMGNGKSTMLLSQMASFAAARLSTYYIPLEIDPEVNRLRWAAWTLGLDVRHAIRQDWSKLPEGSHDAIQSVLDEQAGDAAAKCIHFCDEKRLTLPALAAACRWAVEHIGCRVIMLDHFHRLDFGTDALSHRVTVTEVVRRLKDLARELGIVLLAAAQLNRNTAEPLDAYMAPGLGRLKESAGIAEEADVVLMLSRRINRELPDKWAHKLAIGSIALTDYAEPNTMVVTCRKHRLDDSARDGTVMLTVRNGKLESKAQSWRVGSY